MNRRFRQILGRVGFEDAPGEDADAESVDDAEVKRVAPAEAPRVVRGTVRAEKNGSTHKNHGSLRGWHAFRTTFVTRALAGGMPEELVRKVTGHAALYVVRKHYFTPGREDFRQAFEKAMPELRLNVAKSWDERLREII